MAKRQGVNNPGNETSRAAFLSVKTQFENVGDGLIVRELIRALGQRVPTYVDLSRAPSSFQDTLNLDPAWGVHTFRRLGFPRLLLLIVFRRLQGRRVFYFLMPGAIQGEKQGMDELKARIYTGILWLLSLIGTRICHVGISYERIGPTHARLLKSRIRWYHMHAVRDERSRKRVLDMGGRVDRVIPDLALGMSRGSIEATEGRRALAVSFRVDRYPQLQEQIRRFVDDLIHQVPSGFTLKFVSQVERDNQFMEDLWREHLGRSEISAEYHQCSDDIDHCIRVYADCTHVCSNRLHALLLGLSAGAWPVPTVASSRDGKILGALATIGIEPTIVSLGTPWKLPDSAVGDSRPQVQRATAELERFFDSLLHGASSGWEAGESSPSPPPE
jgi:polysaccharide pyruvyl transferase WcaK-like protein